MSKRIDVCLFALLCTSPTLASAQDYLTVQRSAEVERSADDAWGRIGDFCAAGELLDVNCAIDSGDGGVGTIRRLNGVTLEPMVARTPYSYTYSQIEGGRANTDYHGTLAVEPIGESRSRIVYTLVIDRSRLPAGTDLLAYQKAMEDRFQGVVDRAKELLENQS